MKKHVRGWVVAGGVLVVIALLLLGAWFRLTRRSFPETKGTLQVAGLQQAVDIYRDAWGVPQIYAAKSHDLFFAQGYVQAQDRFWQMEFWRRVSSGRLSELFGKGTLKTDRFVRTVGWRRAAEASWKALDPDTQAALQVYADGVNAHIQGRSPDQLALEFMILKLIGAKVTVEPWTPIDTVGWGEVMAWDLRGNMEQELQRAQLLGTVGRRMTAEFFPSYPFGEHPLIVPPGIAWDKMDPALLAINDLVPPILGNGPDVGSNNWVISGKKSVTGKPLLANDPHLAIQMPSIWYEIGLHCTPVGSDCPYDVSGFSFAGVPGVIIGHNARIAWGVTNTGPDVQDLYVEKINPDNPYEYEVNGEWVKMTVLHESIKVKGEKKPVQLNVRITRHGPIINDAVSGPQKDWVYGWQPLALRWTASEPTHLSHSVLAIDRAGNWKEFRDSLRSWDVPAQNFVYADVDGNIGYQMPGKIPIRAKGDGTLPVPGWTDEYEWTGYIPFDSLPNSYNPKRGYLFTANNAVVGPDYPYLITEDWDYGYRARRIGEMLAAKEKLSAEDFARMQGDTENESAGEVIPYLAKLHFTDPVVQAAARQLSKWNLQESANSPEAALYEIFWTELLADTFHDELPPALWPSGSSRSRWVVHQLLAEPQDSWWDNVFTDPRETRDDILRQAFIEACARGIKAMGKDLSKWHWGTLHTATFRNQTLGESGVAPIEAIFNRGPFPMGGSSSLVDATSYRANKNTFTVAWMPSMRMIVDLGTFSRSLAVHTTGQSGHPYARHYDDMINLWQKGEYHPMLWGAQNLKRAAKAHLRLEPAP